jgi:hypothetical protein
VKLAVTGGQQELLKQFILSEVGYCSRFFSVNLKVFPRNGFVFECPAVFGRNRILYILQHIPPMLA